MIRKKGKFEQPRVWPKQEPSASPEHAVPSFEDLHDAPTMQVPVLPPEIYGNAPYENFSQDAPRPAPESVPLSREENRSPQHAGTASKKAGPGTKKCLSPGLLTTVIGGASVLVLLAAVFIWGMVLKNGEAIYPNVYVAGINVGGMDQTKAVQAVDDAVAASYSSSTLRVQLPDRTISFDPEQTNVALDANEAIASAWNYGRSGDPFSAVFNYFGAKSREHYIDLQTILDLDVSYIRQIIDQVAEEVQQKPSAPDVAFQKETGVLTVTLGQPERSLDADGLFHAVCQSFMDGNFTAMEWPYQEVPCPLVDLTPYYAQYCTEMEDAVYDPKTHTIQDETVGFGFDLAAANQRLATAEPGSKVILQLEDLHPDITKKDLEDRMFGQKLFSKSTVYVNNSNRTNNLRLACEAINGTILNPGEIFSFNDIVGERTAAKGYLPATVYSGGKSLEELGGGVCQVASTIYYATLHMDLEQVQREPHMFAVSYVDLGMDATIYWGSLDYKFKNTLDYPIKIQANVDNGSCNITFWGESPLDYQVKMSYTILATYPWEEVEELDETKPVGFREEKETPYTGYKVVTYKTVTDLQGNEISHGQEAFSTYQKRDHTFIVGPSEDPSVDPNDPLFPEDPLHPEDPLDPQDPFTPVDPFQPSDPEQTDPGENLQDPFSAENQP